MKIITWNCNMAFRKKAKLVMAYQPDIVIVQESEHPDKLKFDPETVLPTDSLWFGNNRNKGLGIFSYGDCRLKLQKTHNPGLRTIIPLTVTIKKIKITLYAIWAYNPGDPDGTYIEQVWKAIDHYDQFMTNEKTILIGDFNSNTIWDRKRRISNHSNVVRRLEEKGIHSCYHLHHKQEQGKEKHSTLYMYRHEDKPYHIDYCFVSADLAKNLQSVEIGEYKQWSPYSDHVPVIVTFD